MPARPDIAALCAKLFAAADVEHELPSLLSAAKRATGATETHLLVPSRDGKVLHEAWRTGRKPRDQAALRIGPEGVCGWVAKFRKPSIVKDNATDSRYVRVDSRYRSMVAVPVLLGTRLMGVLACESLRRARFTKEHLATLEGIAPVAAAALRAVELADRERRAVQRIGLINHLTRAMTVAEPAAFVRRAVDQVRLAFDTFYAGVRVGDYDREEVVLLAHSAAGTASPVPRLKFGQGLTGKAFKLGEVVNAKDVTRDPFYVSGVPGIQSELCVPVRLGDHCVGLLDLQDRRAHAFDADDVVVLETVARLLAPILAKVPLPAA